MSSQFKIQVYIERLALFNDQEAFKKLFEHFYAKLYHFAMSIVKKKEMAEEITSDVFIILWTNRTRLTEINNLNAYLYVAVRNLSVKYLGREQHRHETSVAWFEPDLVKTPDATPEDILLSTELIRHLEASIESLPPKCRTIYKMVRQDGLKYKEIAAILNLSVRTIDAQMAIATRRITQSIRFVFEDKSKTSTGMDQ